MGRVKFLLIMIFACLTCLGNSCVARAAEEFEIEQIQENMPEVEIFLRCGQKPEIDEIEVILGQEILRTESVSQYSDTGNATDYFVLVDVSNSIPDAYCQSIKQALISFADTLAEEDRLVLLSFGEEVTALLSGDETAEQRHEAINGLDNKDKKTLLFEAILQTADMSDKMQDDNRRIVLVISDGEDFAVGAATGNEAIAALNDRNMPVYAMGISDTAKENLNQFGETARKLGGTLTVFRAEETWESLCALQEVWRNTWLVTAYAGSNCVNNQLNRLSVKNITAGYVRSKDVLLTKYQKDMTKPQILKAEKIGDRQVSVSFSEEVDGAENGSAWSVECDGVVQQVVTAVYSGEDSRDVLLTFETELYAGTYCIKAPGVTDVSMEKNACETVFECSFDGSEPPVEEEEQESLLQKFWWVFVLAAFMILLIVLLVIWQKIKRNKGVVYIDGKASLVSNVEEKQRIAVVREEGFPITLELVGGETGRQRVQATINGSLIVGRSSMCELSLEDNKMSRQHFVLECQEGNIYITDLNTTNGTAVNGVAVRKKTRLNPRDIITAGGLQMRIVW